eukprot:m.301168 g.301168  ORF g.301168 m.301168 type:complete len:423 (-) comp55219_c0_seq19:70-1338(-)
MKPLPTHSFILFFLPKSGSTALMYAAAFGYLSCARVLLQGGASTSVKNQAGKTALDFAREYMRTNVVTLLEGEVSEHNRLLDAQQNIKPAVREEAQSRVQISISERAPRQQNDTSPQAANLLTTESSPPPSRFAQSDVSNLFFLVHSDKLVDCQSIVQKCGKGIITARFSGGGPFSFESGTWTTALHMAAALGRTEILNWFLQQGIDCNTVNCDGWTALMNAAFCGELECARALLDAGVLVRAMARSESFLSNFFFLGLSGPCQAELLMPVRPLLFVCSKHPGENTALELAQEKRHSEMVALLEEHERLVDAQQNIKPAVREQVQSSAQIQEQVEQQQQQQESLAQAANLLATPSALPSETCALNLEESGLDEATRLGLAEDPRSAASGQPQEATSNEHELEEAPPPVMDLSLTDLDFELNE